MADIPPIKTNKLPTALKGYVGAAEAVREGIATHVQKHRAALHAERSKAAANLKLTQSAQQTTKTG